RARARVLGGRPPAALPALALNSLFCGPRASVAEPFRYLFCAFLETYLRESHDGEILEVLPPFLAFRALVIAHPLWYPELSDRLRRALIHFGRRLMTAVRFDPAETRSLLG